MTEKLYQETARNLMLASLGLTKPIKHKTTKTDVLETILKIGQLQIDTINVVARSPYLVLWSRLGSYEPKWLDELLAEKQLFEYWSHAMCFLSVADFPLYRRLMLNKKHGWNKSDEWTRENKKTVNHVLKHVHEHGETRSSDFTRTDGQKGAWWNWKAEKIALEMLFNKGEIMIARRHNFHRIYNLREKILPNWDDSKTPSYSEVQKALAIKAIKALGMATVDWLADYFYTPKREMPEVVKSLIAEGEILEIDVDGWGKAYVHKSVEFLDVPKPA